ncbi:MAG: S41 family peptidase [Lewinellaceae bacterium]|nr:S41 family peptidase [Lewinellaceae bacterium]
MSRLYAPLIALFAFALMGCEQVLFDDNIADNPQENFEYLWRECNEKYAFFDYKGIDWDEVHDRYATQVRGRIGSDSLFRVLFAMLNELRDGHVNLISYFNVSRFDVRLLGPENINDRVVLEHYLGDNYYTTGPFRHTFLANEEVGYIRYESFSNTVSEFDMSYMLNRYGKTRGIILDLRQNGGGRVSNVFTMLNRLVSKKTLLYNSYIKNGPGREDFSEAQPAYAEPPEKSIRYTKPVIILIDRGSFSATSFLALGARELPNVTLMGDTTGGGLGIPNGGQLPNGWTYRFSISRTLSPQGENFEAGVPPDIRVLLDPADAAQGKDTVIERAIRELIR